MEIYSIRKIVQEELNKFLNEEIPDLYVKQLVDKYGEDGAKNFLTKQVAGTANLPTPNKEREHTKYQGYLNSFNRMYGSKAKTEALTVPRAPVHHPLKAEPVLSGADDYVYELVRKFGQKATLDYIQTQMKKPVPSIKRTWKHYLDVFKTQKKKGLYSDFNESVKSINSNIILESKVIDPALANAISKVKSHISTIRSKDKKKFAHAYFEYCLTGESYPRARDFEVPGEVAAHIKNEIHNMWTTETEK